MTEFYGFERSDGSVGVRNHLLVMAPMDCSIEPARKIAAQVEGAVAVTQHHGCRNDPMVANALILEGEQKRTTDLRGEPLPGMEEAEEEEAENSVEAEGVEEDKDV